MEQTKQLNRQELFSILNGKISMIINRYLYGRFKDENLGITVEQWTVLACLWEQDKVTQQTLSDRTYRDKPSITRLIDNLEKNGLVIRMADSSDRRVNLIYLTKKGADLEKKATEIVDELVSNTLDEFTDEDVLVCRNVVKKILTKLGEKTKNGL